MLFLTPVLVAGVAIFIKPLALRHGDAQRGGQPRRRAPRRHLREPHVARSPGPSSGAIAAFTVILFVPTQGFVSTTGSFGPDDPAAGARRRGGRPHDEPAGGDGGRCRSRRDRAAAAVELPARRTGRGGAVRDHPRRAAAAAAPRRAAATRSGAPGRRCSPGRRWPRTSPARARCERCRVSSSARSVIVGVIVGLSRRRTRTAVKLATIIAFAIVGFSVGIVTGLGGQLTFGQFAIAAIGATASYRTSPPDGELPDSRSSPRRWPAASRRSWSASLRCASRARCSPSRRCRSRSSSRRGCSCSRGCSAAGVTPDAREPLGGAVATRDGRTTSSRFAMLDRRVLVCPQPATPAASAAASSASATTRTTRARSPSAPRR